jgi:hypothetical protein
MHTATTQWKQIIDQSIKPGVYVLAGLFGTWNQHIQYHIPFPKPLSSRQIVDDEEHGSNALIRAFEWLVPVNAQ